MRTVLFTTLSLLAFVSVASAKNTRPDLNAFVDHKITTTQSLVSQVRTDSAVADRYERHFAMTRPELVAYLGSLHRGTLSKGGMYTIYSVPNDGHVKMHVGKLAQGSAVFLNKRGAPILVAKCGNPVVLGPIRARHGNPLQHDGDDMEARQMPNIPTDLALGKMVDANELLADVPETAIETVPDRDIRGGSTLFPPSVPGGGAFPLGAIGAGLASLGAIDLSLSGGINGGGGLTPVPEPMTIAAFGLGALALVRRRRKA